MSIRLNFTKTALAELLKNFSVRQEVYDDRQPGLMAELRSKDSLAFYFYQRVNGIKRKYRLGSFPQLSVENARKLTVKTYNSYLNGDDPAAERRLARVEHTLAGLFNYWLETHAKQKRKSWREDQRLYDKHLVQWANRRLSSISTADIELLHSKIGGKSNDDKPYLANRIVELLRAMFNKADRMGFQSNNPADPVEMFDEESRERFLLPEEMPAFMASLQQEPELFQDFFLLCLYSGARRSNVQSMRWEDVHLADAPCWQIPTTKNKTPQLVHLPKEAVEILHRRRDQRTNHEWVFPAHSKSGHLQEPKAVWKRIVERAKLKDLRIHDLRRTLGSWQALGGSSLLIIGKSLGHKSIQASAIYSRLTMEPVKASVDKAVAAMLQASQAKPKSKRKRKSAIFFH
jgi:integrase